jgi:hypothetical protein
MTGGQPVPVERGKSVFLPKEKEEEEEFFPKGESVRRSKKTTN